jgi:hypothetical protein
VTPIPAVVDTFAKYIEDCGIIFGYSGPLGFDITISPEDIVDLGLLELVVALVVRVMVSFSSLFAMYLPGKPVEAEDIVDLGRFELVVSLIVAILLTIPVEAEDIRVRVRVDLGVLELVVALVVGLDFGVTFPLSLGRTVAVLLILTSFFGGMYLINLSRLLR